MWGLLVIYVVDRVYYVGTSYYTVSIFSNTVSVHILRRLAERIKLCGCVQ